MMTFAKTSAMGAAMMIAAVVAVPAMAKPAAVSHDGKYVSNEAKSYWSNGEFPKGFKLSIDLKWTANKLEYHAVNTTNPAKPYLNNFEATLDDVPGPLHENARFNQIRIKQLDANTYQVLEQKDGDVIVGQYWRFSPDGKTLVRWGVGKAPDGKSKAFLEWFDRAQ
ncbi:hypothetical protein [Novosphingobium rosa]|uniref:hypothetical protein n=1 Tax=Novosphingobium rosa TaxID=76978 RepID=UPI000B23EA30|nr:hypothetical protein [Novosphingobium rosa]